MSPLIELMAGKLRRLFMRWTTRTYVADPVTGAPAAAAEINGQVWGNGVVWTATSLPAAADQLTWETQRLVDLADRLDRQGSPTTLNVAVYGPQDMTARLVIPNSEVIAAQAGEIARLTAEGTAKDARIAALEAELAARPPAEQPQPLWRGRTTGALLIRDKAGNEAVDPALGSNVYPTNTPIEVWGETTVPLRPGAELSKRYFYRADLNLNVWVDRVVREA